MPGKKRLSVEKILTSHKKKHSYGSFDSAYSFLGLEVLKDCVPQALYNGENPVGRSLYVQRGYHSLPTGTFPVVGVTRESRSSPQLV